MKKVAHLLNKPKVVDEPVLKKDSSPLKRRVTLIPPKTKNTGIIPRTRTKQ
jgi:hypothetical protein